ncbi:MAG TPA: cell wall-binding repeat-containing protein [Mycobacteriales bacterium]|jgi:Tol biopolymer transport system component/soluble P-type ATPase|nr:cell wall-binding repeat-containing protein [Mycobacteriales bacterium]
MRHGGGLLGSLLAGLVGAAFLVVPGAATPMALAAVSSTDLPPSAPDRLAYSTAVYTSDAQGQGMTVHGLGTIGLDGTDQRTLTDPPSDGSFDHSPQWSPDGSWLAYLQDRPDPSGSGSIDQVALIPRDGGTPQIVDPHGWRPAWSPDGLHLAWVSVADTGDESIAVADVVVTPASVVVTNRRSFPIVAAADADRLSLGGPEFSADGLRLAYAMGDAVADNARLYTLSVVTGETHAVSHGVGLAFDGNGNYSFSPDGSKLLFLAVASPQSGAPEPFIVNADGTDQHRILNLSDFYAFAATWSPTGDTVAVATNAAYKGVLILGLDGTQRNQLAANTFQDWGGLTFAPDGSRIFTVASPGRPGDGNPWAPDLYAIPVNGDPVQRLTTDHSVFPGTVQAVDPGSVIRQFGDGEIPTAVAGVLDTVRSASTVVLGDASDFASTLAASPLAAKLHAPVLLTSPGSLAGSVRRALTRLHTTNVVVAGEISDSVVAALRATGLQVSRVAHTSSTYLAAATVARRLTAHRAVVVPTVESDKGAWRLPLAASGFASFKRWPLLYTRHASVPPSVAHAIRRMHITSVTVVGDDSDVRSRLLRQLSNLGVDVHRVRTSDPYTVSARFADRARAAGARIGHPVVASGSGWTRSISAPALAAFLSQINVLVDSRSISRSIPTGSWLARHSGGIATARLLGDVTAVRPRVEAQLEHRV